MSGGARTVAFATLGCKLNQFETDSIATQLRDDGFRIVEFSESADVYVINSCTVTNRADRKSRNLHNRASRASAEGLVVLTGCYVDSHRESLESDGSTYIVPNEQKQSIPELIRAHFRGEIIHPAGSVFDFPVPDRVFHTRSTVKIQDGCDNFCTFCIIPYVRGRASSRPWHEVAASIREAVAGGAREIVMTGVNMSRYRDGAVDFTGLVERVLEIGGEWRLRISSLEPDGLTDRFTELFRHPRMAPHLHLCLQSASERVLLSMRRQYTYDEYVRIAAALRAIDPLFNITTDIIVGFPGEEERDFAASLVAVDELRFGHVHTFPYSVRRGTRAERMPGHIPARIRTERSALIRSAAERAKRAYRERLIGRHERLLVEDARRAEDDPGAIVLRGLGEHYVPIEARVPDEAIGASPAELVNTFHSVHVTGIACGDDPVLFGHRA